MCNAEAVCDMLLKCAKKNTVKGKILRCLSARAVKMFYFVLVVHCLVSVKIITLREVIPSFLQPSWR